MRVESSKNRLTTVRPRSVGSFLTVRGRVPAISSAVSRIERRVVAAQVGRREQVPLHASGVPGSSRTASLPSCSVSCTWIVSRSEVGRFLPT